MKNIADLREHLFAQLEALADPDRKIDLRRMRLTHDIAERIIDTARVEVQFAAVMKGAMDVPFIEDQAEERGQPAEPLTPAQRHAAVLGGGPSAEHPWRASVHRMKT